MIYKTKVDIFISLLCLYLIYSSFQQIIQVSCIVLLSYISSYYKPENHIHIYSIDELQTRPVVHIDWFGVDLLF